MKQQTRSKIANGLNRAGLLGPVESLRERWLTLQARGGPATGPDGLPLPPAKLRLLVDGRSGDAERFLWVGDQLAASIRTAVAEAGNPLESLGSILDFGCGCGRVARHWASLEGPTVHGCDYNPELVGWCRQNLSFMEAKENQLEPPTPYDDESFDLIYAFSVLSHLSEPLQGAWVAEFRRILRPGGLLIVSVLGHACRDRMESDEKVVFDRGELVVQRPRMAGRNLCTAYHPREYVSGTLLADFTDVTPLVLGQAESPMMQDGYIARRPAA